MEQDTEVYESGEVAAPSEPRPYLLVFAGNSASVVTLPRDGVVHIGRDREAGVHLEDAKVSRHHAALSLHAGRATIQDLGSNNGTFIDGVRATGPVALRPGAVVAISGIQLVFHGGAPARERLWTPAMLRDKLADEIERAAHHERHFAVVAMRNDGPADAVAEVLIPELRAIDRVTTGGGDTLVFLPELDGPEAGAAADHLVAVVAARCRGIRAGWALWPRDGGDADALIAAARSAAVTASPGVAAPASESVRRLELGDQRVLIADEAMARLYELLERVAAVDLPVLLIGETGTGKELAAAAVHHLSSRRAGPRVTFNCAALQDTLAESELFGHERGAFTGAHGDKIGLLEAAAGGTVFLDEVSELSTGVQAKLLRVLEQGTFNRIGAIAERTIDVRVVAATNRDLLADVETGRFRRDLYYRLSAATLWLPPLRDRPREIPILAGAFLAAGRRAAGRDPASLSEEALRRLVAHRWPGNVRELRNCIEFLAATAGAVIDAAAVERYLQRDARAPGAVSAGTAEDTPAPRIFRPIKDEVRELERTRMVEALRAASGNQTLAAAMIEMPLRTFVTKLKQYAIDPKDPDRAESA